MPNVNPVQTTAISGGKEGGERWWGNPWGSRAPFGTILETKGIPANTGVPFFVGKCPVGKFWYSL
jgi:hypothetical protein